MLLIFFGLWIVLNGRLTWETAIMGVVIAIPVYIFFCRYMHFSPKKEIRFLQRVGFAIRYIFVLLCEIVKANFAVIHLILSSKYEVEPALVEFHTELKSDIGKVTLANSITLTPGTISVEVEGDRFLVHGLDKDLLEDIDNTVFEQMLLENERKGQKR